MKARSEYVSVKFRSYNGDWNNTDLIYMRAEEAVFIKAEAEAHSNIAAAKKTLKDYVTTAIRVMTSRPLRSTMSSRRSFFRNVSRCGWRALWSGSTAGV